MSNLATLAVVASIALATNQVEAAKPHAFDLICHAASGPRLHFRFDLAEKKWCIGQCETVGGIDGLGDGAIKLVTYSSDGNNDWTFLINRYTSTFSAIHRGYGDEPADSGECKAQPFSGFPTRKF